MLKSAINRILELAAPTTYVVNGEHFASEQLYRIEVDKKMPRALTVNGLDSVCKLVRNEVAAIGRKLFIQISDYRSVKVFSTYDKDFERCTLYNCAADTPQISMGRYISYENAVVELRSLYIPNEGTNYLMSLLASITQESKVTSTDNGVTQKVEAKTGIALNQMVEIRPRVNLQPFRTFVEVEQPESEFLLRIDNNGCIGLFPADGGVWKLEATRNVAAYFEENLKDLIDQGKIVVIR